MKALVLQETGKLVMRDEIVPHPGPGELLVRTKAATICTSDLNDIKHNAFGIRMPMIMGHEGSGDVAAVGEGVQGFKVGDEITAHPVIPCGHCRACLSDLGHLCDEMSHLGIDKGGVFAEYFLIRADRARIIPHATIDYAVASLMEPVSVCLEAIHRGNVQETSDVLVMGDGPFGILTTMLLPRYTRGKILLAGRHPFRLQHAENAIQINERESPDIARAVADATQEGGVDCAILCVGTAQAVDGSIAALRARGTLSVFSAVQPAPTVDLFKVHVKELNICGSCNDEKEMDDALALLLDPLLGLGRIITHRLDFFTQWQEAFHLAEHGKDEALKVSMTFQGGAGA